MVKNLGENIAAISSGFKNVSSQMETFLAKSGHQNLAIPTNSISSSSSGNPVVLPRPLPRPPILARQPLPQLDQAEYPKVRQWAPDKYNGCRKAGKAGQGEGPEGGQKMLVLSSYMEDENGRLVLPATRDAVRSMARSFFWQLMRNNLAPPKWGDVSLDISNEMIFQLESGFPWLWFCEDHWKAKRVATNSYSQWYPGALIHFKEEQAKAQQGIINVIDIDDDEPPCQRRPLKRRVVEDDGEGPSKHPHLEEGPSLAAPSTNRQRVSKQYHSHHYVRH